MKEIKTLMDQLRKGELTHRDFLGRSTVDEDVALKLALALEGALKTLEEAYREELDAIPVTRNYKRLDMFGKFV